VRRALPRRRLLVVRGCVHRRGWRRGEVGRRLRRLVVHSAALGGRARAWAQEFCAYGGVGAPSAPQHLCGSSGRKRSIVRLYQLFRLEVRQAFAVARLPGLHRRNG
jgi:ribosomal protein S14